MVSACKQSIHVVWNWDMDAQLQISDSILIKENLSYKDRFKIECVPEIHIPENYCNGYALLLM